MADSKSGTAELSTQISGPGADVTVSEDARMPEAEPFHRVAEQKQGEVFDPNAARREAENRGPGLQDSEALHPAHWNPEYTDEELRAARVKQLDREIARLKAERDAVKKGDA
jgi:hypothetical protein